MFRLQVVIVAFHLARFVLLLLVLLVVVVVFPPVLNVLLLLVFAEVVVYYLFVQLGVVRYLLWVDVRFEFGSVFVHLDAHDCLFR